jgi:hypothetical protein
MATKLYDSASQPRPPAATCTCTCGNPITHCATGLYCATQPLSCWDLNGKSYQVNEACMAITPPGSGAQSCGAQNIFATAACAPLGQQTLPPFEWAPNVVTCGEKVAAAAACGAGRVCAVRPPGTAVGPCVVAPGEIACPNSTYLQRSVLFTRFTDTRGCAFSCSCTDAKASCSCTTSGCGVILAQSCNGSTFATIPVVNSCQGVAVPGSAATWGAMLFGYTPTVITGCTPGGSSAPTGGLAVIEPQTVCCMQ